MFDEEAAAVCNQNYRVCSAYNGRGEYTNFFYKWDAMYMNDVLENCVVFVLDDYTAPVAAPATKPADWDSVYAIANSPYYIADASGTVTINGKKYKQLTASDKSTTQGFSWDNYKAKDIVKKIGA